jgi:hypothetical protein
VTAIFWAWGISAAVLVLLAVILGAAVTVHRSALSIFIDNRGRYSLTHFQLVVWSIVILSLISGVFWGRLIDGVKDPLQFTIPDQILGLLGISVGSAVAGTTIKSTKDASPSAKVIAAPDPPHFMQIFMAEEGALADKVVDVTKFQNFIITVVLVVAYVALAIDQIHDAKTAAAVGALPALKGTFLVLLGISHGGYLAAKIPPQEGPLPPEMPSVASRRGAT